jgi:hypothetical protein
MGKVFGIILFLFLMALVVVSYSKFIVGLTAESWMKNMAARCGFDKIIPDISFCALSDMSHNPES